MEFSRQHNISRAFVLSIGAIVSYWVLVFESVASWVRPALVMFIVVASAGAVLNVGLVVRSVVSVASIWTLFMNPSIRQQLLGRLVVSFGSGGVLYWLLVLDVGGEWVKLGVVVGFVVCVNEFIASVSDYVSLVRGVSLTHECGAELLYVEDSSGTETSVMYSNRDSDEYEVSVSELPNHKAYYYSGACPQCGGSLTPSETRVLVRE